jgi:hypothetical protein
MRIFLQVFMLLVSAVTVVRADINVTLDNPDQTGVPGTTLQFFGTITNSGVDTVFLNSDNINFTSAPSFSVNDLFFSNVPISLGGGQSSGDIELFDISLSTPFTDPFVLYGGSYTLTGGVDAGSQDVLATANFSVTATESLSTTPEPGFLIPVALGLCGLLFAKRRRHRA